MKLKTHLAPLVLLGLTGLCGATSAAAQDGETNREIHGIAQEQEQLLRQLRRLRSTMEVLLQRLEAEGRTRTADLLRDAIVMLEQRTTPEQGDSPMTIEERMERARETLRSGQLVQSLESQRDLVDELERLLSILLDRKNLGSLEDKIAELRELQASLSELATRESELRKDTVELRDHSANESQKALEKKLGELIERERKLLSKNESLGRESGTLELEQLERELARLLRDQRTDASVLEAWNPDEARAIDEVKGELAEAQRDEARAARLDAAAKALARASATAPEDMQETLEALEEAAKRAELHRDASGDEAAARAAEALRRATEKLEELRGESTDEGETSQSAAELADEAEALAQEAADARARAAEARRQAAAALAEQSQSDSAAGEAAEAIKESLDAAEEAAKEGNDEGARRATDDAVAKLEKARRDLSMLGGALSSSQEDQAKRTDRVERGLGTMPQAETEAGERARANLARAAEAMRAAAEAARTDQAETARSEARAAERALQSALSDLKEARGQAAEAQATGTEKLSEAQAQLAQEAAAAAGQVAQGSMNEKAQADTKAALERAREAMERASQELSEGRSASAAGSQREAMQEMQKALQSASEGVTPESAAGRQRAQELAAEQERIREDLLDLARRIRERENASPMPNLDRADDAAQEATSALNEGSLAQAEEKEREVEQELKQTKDRLEEEEEQYQQLREEEKLFRIAEETKALLDGHRDQMRELIEIDALRRPGTAPSRAQRLRLRRVSREEESLGTRTGELSTAIIEEGALVSGQLFQNAADDLERIATALSDKGDYETGTRTQALQRDVEESMVWMLDALNEEQARRQEESKSGNGNPPPPGENKDSLIPDTAELKLLRRMEFSLQDDVLLILQVNPELADTAPDEVDPHLLRDIARLALRHEKITENFTAMRRRLGIPDPEEIED